LENKKEVLRKIVYDVVLHTDKSLVKNKKADECDDIQIFGQLDSLSMVNLVVALEEAIKREFGESIPLIDDNTTDPESSPFRTIGSMADYLFNYLKKE